MNSKDQPCKLRGTQIRWKQPHGEQKKRARRRRPIRRPYKEKLLNMAEARREIVTALKIHRASMKEASERQQKQEQESKQPLPLHTQLYPRFEPQGRMRSWRNPRIYPGCSYNCSCYSENFSSSAHMVSSNAISLFSSPITPLPVAENLNFELPVQTLGLNLNLHNFRSTDTAVICNNSHSFYTPSLLSPSSYICQTVSHPTLQEAPKSITLSEEGLSLASGIYDSNVSTGESDKDLQVEISSIRKEHQKAMEIGEEPGVKAVEIDGHHTFDKVMEFPDWLSINDNFLQQLLNYQCSQDCFQDPGLSCMDIGEIEDVNEEDWLA